MSKELEIIKQRLNTIRENTKVGNRRIADEENEECVKCIETCLSDIEKSLKVLEIIKKLIYINDNGEVRFLPKNKHIIATGILDKEAVDLLKEILL